MTIGHGQAISRSQDVDRSCPEGALSRSLFRKLHAQTVHHGELRLAVAVLEDAVHCLERNQGTRKFIPLLIRWEAEQWITSRDRDSLFSFENVCSYLCLNAGTLRDQIFRWRQQQRHEAV